MQYEYDSSGLFFYYFLTSLLLLFLAPTFISLLPHKKQATKQEIQCECLQCQRKQEALRKKEKEKKWEKKTYLKIVMVIMLVACLVGIATTEMPERKGWSPFEVMGVDQDVDEKTVKKIYRKMAMQYHPDRLASKDDEEKKVGEAKFIEITKAMKALTDDTARKNWEETGDPDGKQSFALGIALPTWLVSAENRMYVMAVYILAFVLLLPLIVQKWWNRSKKVTKDGISHPTMARFYKGIREETTIWDLITVVSCATEFDDLKGASIWPQVLETADKRGFDLITPKKANYAFELIWAHLLRIPLQPKEKEDQAMVIALLPRFLYGLFQIAAAHQYVTPSTLCIDLTAVIVQATFANKQVGALAQLPGVSIETAVAIVDKKITLKEFSTMDLAEQKKLFAKPVMDVAITSQIAKSVPRIVIGAGVFKVIGENAITPGAIITFALSVRFATTSVKAEEDLFATNDFELDLDDEKLDPSAGKKGAAANVHAPAHSPYYPTEKRPVWWVLLGNLAQNRMVTAPVRITDLEEGKVKIVRMQFQAPEAGEYDLHAFVMCDSWIGSSEDCPVKLVVTDEAEEEAADEDEVSDTEGASALRPSGDKVADSDISDFSSEFSEDSD